MEERRGDNNSDVVDGEERRGTDRLTIPPNKSYSRRPLSSRMSENHSINNRHLRSTTFSVLDDDRRYQHASPPSDRLPSQMKSSSAHYISNPSLVPVNSLSTRAQQLEDSGTEQTNESTYSFRREFNKLRSAKSHGELYHPHAPLPLPPTSRIIPPEENDPPYRSKYVSESPSSLASTTRSRSLATTVPILVTPAEEHSHASSSQKLPIWKRFKKIITPRKNKDHPHPRKHSSPKLPTTQLNEPVPDERNRSVSDSIANGGHYHHHHHQQEKLQNPIKLSELRTWLTSKPFPEQRIRDEYEKLPTEVLHPKTLAIRPENRQKNRFNAIEPYDHSRVVLRLLSTDPASDYINASYIDGYRASKLYIAAQAPTEATVPDFLRMIWQLRIQSIIMVTRLFEDGKHKCIQYWPDEGEKRVNDFRIRLETEEKYADYTIRRFALYNQAEPSEMLSVKHYHFLSWPDHGCLALSTPLLDFRQRFRADYRPSNPILVHCSAGVGRSGTFIALDALLEAAEHQETIDVLDFTHQMRQNRVYMIQTAEQYVFLYRTLIEGILTVDTSIPLQEFLTTKKLRVDSKSQYKLLEQLQSSIEYSYRSATDPANVNKNRSDIILASDNNRPYLMTHVEKSTDYINAIFVNSYRQTPTYIVTQYPLPHTQIDFWRLVYDHNVSIVMLLESISRDQRSAPYWPSGLGQVIPVGPFELVMTSQKEDEYLIERVIDLKCLSKNLHVSDRTRTIRQFQVKENSDRLFIVKRFLKEMRTYGEQNVILQCLNGATWSGYFAALCNSIDKMQTEQVVDPFKIVRLLRAIRPQFIDQNQYENLFASMFDYAQKYLINSSSTRSNENSSYPSTSSGHDQSAADNRVPQRL